ncbi:hypothetical protein COW36_01645 [bacterium (Candidatus Blackallbacteria) CG17_big_fil_post_rev_8_21_14_2_50_48_46]|uniref:Uncharacterized protein n=1 Tax=bacterium (Candidatus Blackallbacteria) CG17_big_fil_post_rev_8_21_14_2_50_48_46 TaxID=2014261 RepID=A0A2M7GBL7_9BACT|nr:MAG: hypothetical protein COW64_09530 [bacterium (Candidatus Blackallbacteria) CG18_big_fil_WC_8_21_14_2_50_49_26]PIW19569.1 MAG: hypothetical protein COW36_01645 [bacterium (Candidatus Blackallbacteria) CG17_big_fil_post_rev_8_21_14_2_50_48_46]PIW48828.1 MAG: hypothetical protein COW20_06810 [bacterium (Candidatus Blackallbacteria) CG13_big_fil_rev_8_21_14_2_50_49_14]
MNRSDRFFKIFFLACLMLGFGFFAARFACSAQPDKSLFSVQKQILLRQNQRFFLHGVNYYPQEIPWSLFWNCYSTVLVREDFRNLKRLGFNTVRIFVPYQVFGGRKPEAVMMAHLKDLLNQAQAQGLVCIVTLFDMFSEYADLESSQAHLSRLLSDFAGHPAILAWDLKNEVDLDYPHYSRPVVQAWLKHLSQAFHRLAPRSLLTVGWSNPERALDLQAQDLVSFHYFDYEQRFAQRVSALRKKTQKPLLLQEFGFHTWQKAAQDPHPLAHQFNYFNSLQAGALKLDLMGSMVWCLYDYPPALREAWVLDSESFQHHMGILDLAKQAKPGLKALQQAVFILDARSGKSVDSSSRELEIVFRLAQAGPVQLLSEAAGKITQRKVWPGRVGVNSFHWSVSASELRNLLELRSQYQLKAQDVQDLKGNVLKQNTFPLILRRD